MNEPQVNERLLTLERTLDRVRNTLGHADMEPWRFNMLKARLDGLERQIAEVVQLCEDGHTPEKLPGP